MSLECWVFLRSVFAEETLDECRRERREKEARYRAELAIIKAKASEVVSEEVVMDTAEEVLVEIAQEEFQ